jgi:hypothetical protein
MYIIYLSFIKGNLECCSMTQGLGGGGGFMSIEKHRLELISNLLLYLHQALRHYKLIVTGLQTVVPYLD